MIQKLNEIPECVQHLYDPPQQLYVRSQAVDNFEALLGYKRVAIIGSRRMTPYGSLVTQRIASELAAEGFVIISGLALGIDGLAHEAALKAGGGCLAVLPSPVERIYPAQHWQLANRILAGGGALVSEYPAEHDRIYKTDFIARNRLIAALADAVIIPEAAEASGSLHTAGFAFELGRPVLAVPGAITNPLSAGTNNLLKEKAVPLTSVKDVYDALNYTPRSSGKSRKARQAGDPQ